MVRKELKECLLWIDFVFLGLSDCDSVCKPSEWVRAHQQAHSFVAFSLSEFKNEVELCILI